MHRKIHSWLSRLNNFLNIYLQSSWTFKCGSYRGKLNRPCIQEFTGKYTVCDGLFWHVLYYSGMYCGSEGLPDVTGPCDPGYYCPAGQVSATPANYSCQPGYYCVGGKSAPEGCPSGSYQVRLSLSTELIYNCDQARVWHCNFSVTYHFIP